MSKRTLVIFMIILLIGGWDRSFKDRLSDFVPGFLTEEEAAPSPTPVPAPSVTPKWKSALEAHTLK